MLEITSTRFDRHLRSAAVALALLLALASGTARADLAIAADLELDIPVGLDAIDTGPGFAIRVGYQLDIPLFTFTPEIGFHYAGFDPEPSLYRGIAGARLGIGEVLRGGVFAHIGIGHASVDTPIGDASHTALSFDVGAFLDLTILPLIDVGIHVGYGHVAAEGQEDPLTWVPLGVHAALVF